MGTAKRSFRRLAIEGGLPVRDRLLPYGRQKIAEEEDIAAVVEVGFVQIGVTTGPKVEEFEEAIAFRVGARFAVAFNSGTAGLHAAVFAAGLKVGDEARSTTPLTFAATANCLLYQEGTTPVFADVCADALNLDPWNEWFDTLRPGPRLFFPSTTPDIQY